MLHRKPMGKYHVQVCTNISCLLVGGEELYQQACKKLGIGHKEVTADGRVSLEEVECMGACSWAPAIQVNYDFYHDVTWRNWRSCRRAASGEAPKKSRNGKVNMLMLYNEPNPLEVRILIALRDAEFRIRSRPISRPKATRRWRKGAGHDAGRDHQRGEGLRTCADAAARDFPRA